MYDAGRPHPDGRQRPDLDLRRRASERDPGEGRGAHRPVGVLVRQDRPHRRQPLRSRRPRACPDDVRGRAMVVRRLEMLPVECVVRGYITGSGWKDYQATGKVSGIELPPGLRESERLPTPIFTPSTKAETGTTRRSTSRRGGARRRPRADGAVRDVSIELYISPPATRASAGSSSPTRSSSSASTRPARSSSATRCSRPTPRATGRPTSTRRAAGSRASTSSTCATGRAGSGWDKTPPAPELPAGRRRGHARALRRRLRAHHRRAASTTGWPAPPP